MQMHIGSYINECVRVSVSVTEDIKVFHGQVPRIPITPLPPSCIPRVPHLDTPKAGTAAKPTSHVLNDQVIAIRQQPLLARCHPQIIPRTVLTQLREGAVEEERVTNVGVAYLQPPPAGG